jgi:Ser/Thr protein kinase RdoA (MazF antagonist)
MGAQRGGAVRLFHRGVIQCGPMPPRRPPDSVAAAVLRDRWRIVIAPDRAASGASRNTWRVDSAFWLSHSDATEEASFRREAQLLQALAAILAARKACWCIPGVVPTVSGETIAVTRDGVWRLAQHLPGEPPDMRAAETYPALALMLAEVHAVLQSVPHSLKVRELGAVERAREFIAAYGKASFQPATEDAREALAVSAMVEWLAPRIGALVSLPRQLIHGDWTPPNIKILAPGWGVLDWEFSRIDPAVMDLAQSCITILIWSGLGCPGEHISKLVETYNAHSGREVSMDSVQTAMAAYWLQNYGHWRRRQETVGGFEDVVADQPGRLLAIAEFVTSLAR